MKDKIFRVFDPSADEHIFRARNKKELMKKIKKMAGIKYKDGEWEIEEDIEE